MADSRALDFIQQENHLAFNQLVASSSVFIDLTGAHLRGYDLRKFDLRQVDLSDAYMRATDLRGLDLREAILDGASMIEAKVSGTFFPAYIPASEIRLSLEFGTRIRAHAPENPVEG